MNQELLNGVFQVTMVTAEILLGFVVFWIGQFAYQRFFRRWDLNLELFGRDNPAVAIALVGFYLGIVLALAGVLDKVGDSWQESLQLLTGYGIGVVVLMLISAWVGDRIILRRLQAAREIQEEQNVGAATTEAGLHVANGLILSAALGGQSGTWFVGAICWVIGLLVLMLVSWLYPQVARYDVFGEIRKRNNPAAGVAFAGFLVATGNVVRVAFAPEFQTWATSFKLYGLVLVLGLLALAAIRWLADFMLVPGVKISDEIVNQTVPNFGAGLIESFAYVAGSFLIAWSLLF
jgi:uncharacterized membrane protein YjfL (UPF0719 family)